jgi:pSer/pThr/pTyr-binding forkhead associated (FHA) protein/uncharacterized protein involved in exopolysaccharide biosynthesis
LNVVPDHALAEPIEATLEPPDDDDMTRTRPASDTVIINVEQSRSAEQAGGQYLMVRPGANPPAHLLVCMGANVGHRYPINDTEIVIGRSDRCTVKIDDDRVSSRHAELVRRGGRYRIYDLGSSNGTLVNAQRVDEIDLRDGDLIQIGYTVFKYVAGDALEKSSNAHNTNPGRTVVDQGVQQNLIPALANRAQPPVVSVPASNAQVGLGPVIPQAGGVAARVRDEDEEVSLAEMLAQLRKVIDFFWPYRWVMAGLSALGFAAGGVSAFIAPPKVAAFFEVSLQSKASDNPIEKFSNSNVEFFRSAATNFRSTGLIEKTLLSLGIERPTPGLVQAAQNSLTFVNIGGTGESQTYVGSYRGETPENSLQFLEKHVQLYLDTEIDKTLKVIRASVEFLEKQVKDNEEELKRTENELTEFKKKNIDGLPDQAKQYYDYLFELQKRESDLGSEISRLQAEASVDARRVASESPLVESRVLATRPYQQAIVDVNRQLAESRARGLAEDHPDIRQLKAKLEELRRLESDAKTSTDDTEVEKSRNVVYDSSLDRLQRLQASAAATHQEREKMRQEGQRIKKIVESLPQLEAQYADLTRSYDATKQLHTRLFDQLKTTQLQYELERASAAARYEIITAPRLEYISSMKTFGKRAMAAMAAGLALGMLIAAAFQVRKLAASWT